MGYLALYRKWRPTVFEDVVEQEHVVRTLKNSVKTQRIAHAYLFCGTRGTGKTSVARIFARAINCLNPIDGNPCNECAICKGILTSSIMDVVEIDAASNNSVDNIREIRDEIIYTPSQAKYKVYIIDEVHMLSTGAFNALLKTLEEPPPHVVFFLATTEAHKLPATILSRCQRFDFRRITVDGIVKHIMKIAESNNIKIQSEAARLIARMSDGALRDALSILDQCISLGKDEITYDDVLLVVGVVDNTFISKIVDALNQKNVNLLLEYVDRLVMEGKDVTQFVADLILYFRNLLICKTVKNPADIIEASSDMLDKMKEQSSQMDQDVIIFIIKELSELESDLKWSTHPRILLEVALMKICKYDFNIKENDIYERLTILEKKIESGNFPLPAGLQEGRSDLSYVSAANGMAVGGISGLGTKAEDGATASSAVKEEKTASYEVKQKNGGKQVKTQDEKDQNPAVKYIPDEKWKLILNELKKSGRMALYTNLLDSKAVYLNDGVIGIVFESSNCINKIFVSKPENVEALQLIISKKAGREIRIKCIDQDSIMDAVGQKNEPKDEFIEKVSEVAKKLEVPLNIIEE